MSEVIGLFDRKRIDVPSEPARQAQFEESIELLGDFFAAVMLINEATDLSELRHAMKEVRREVGRWPDD